MLDLLFDICKIVKNSGLLLLNADRTNLGIDQKSGDADLVTQYDFKVQRLLYNELMKILPEAGFIGEENNYTYEMEQGFCFMVDPIDGTTNFIKDYHMSAVSVALLKDKAVELGVVYNPYLDELFYAVRGKGSFCNGERIYVSRKPLSEGIVLFGTSPYNKKLAKASFELAFSAFEQALDIRRSGSAALDLCSIAAGRAELYFEFELSPWDYAAGKLIVEEAGGFVSTLSGENVSVDKKSSIIARNQKEISFGKNIHYDSNI